MQNVQQDFEALALTVESNGESLLSVPVQGQGPTPALPRSVPYILDSAKLLLMMQQMADEEAIRIHTSSVKKLMSKTAGRALSDVFHVGFGYAYNSLKAVSFHYVEQGPE